MKPTQRTVKLTPKTEFSTGQQMPRQLTTRKTCRLIPGVFRVCLLAVRIMFAHFRIACQNSVFTVGSVFFVFYLGHLVRPVVYQDEGIATDIDVDVFIDRCFGSSKEPQSQFRYCWW